MSYKQSESISDYPYILTELDMARMDDVNRYWQRKGRIVQYVYISATNCTLLGPPRGYT